MAQEVVTDTPAGMPMGRGYFLSGAGVAVAGVGVEPLGASGMAGAFFGFLASLLPRWPLDMLVSLIATVA
ncbi:MAG TPA: hypothetical protein VI032_18910 [Burkholderiaceae bacterium]